MPVCPKCNKSLGDGAKFCDNCGQKIFEEVFCTNCGAKTTTEYVHCSQCGALLLETEQTAPICVKKPKTPAKVNSPKIKEQIMKVNTKKLRSVLLGIIIVAFLVGAIYVLRPVIASAFEETILYFKDGAIYSAELPSLETAKVGNHSVTGDNGYEAPFDNYGTYLGRNTIFCRNGSRVFYPGNTNHEDDTITLCYKDINKEDQAITVDTDVHSYLANKAGSTVLYTKGENNALYISNLKDKEKIANGVKEIYLSKNAKYVGYFTDKKDFFIWTKSDGATRLVRGAEKISHVSKDMQTVYYLKEAALYKYDVKKAVQEKIAENVQDVRQVYPSGEMYYTTSTVVERPMKDFVIDDLDETDIKDAEKEKIRKHVQHSMYNEEQRTLYYYDGTTNKIVTESLLQPYFEYGYKEPVALVQIINRAKIEKIPLSTFENIEDMEAVEEKIEAARSGAAKEHIVFESSLTRMDIPDKSQTEISFDGSCLYVLENTSDTDEYLCDLYTISLANKKLGTMELCDTEVWSLGTSTMNGPNLVYYKNTNLNDDGDLVADLYVKGEEVGYNVLVRSDWHYFDGEAVFFYSDWDAERKQGTLNMYRNGKTVQVAYDVCEYSPTPDKRIVYLSDYSKEDHAGTLYLYKHNKPKKIADDVYSIVHMEYK